MAGGEVGFSVDFIVKIGGGVTAGGTNLGVDGVGEGVGGGVGFGVVIIGGGVIGLSVGGIRTMS